MPGEVFEVRALGPRKPQSTAWEGTAYGKKPIISGYFDDVAKATEAVAALDVVGCGGIYVTLNPVDPALLGRANNRLKVAENTTSDLDVTLIRWLLIDIDPKRPSGVSSTGEEHQAALDQALWLRAGLAAKGWPEPLYGDSGNGAHLIYRLPDLQNTDENKNLLKDALSALHSLYSVEKEARQGGLIRLDIDRSVFNPARISKIYGTVARKGENIPARPHRRASMIVSPRPEETATDKSVTVQMLRSLIEEARVPEVNDQEKPKQPGSSKFDLGGWLDHYHIAVTKIKPHGDSKLYVLERCIFDSSHAGGEAAIGQTEEGKTFYQCFHNSCKDKSWADVRAKVSGSDRLGKFVEQNGIPGGADPKPKIEQKQSLTTTEEPRPLRRAVPDEEPFPVDTLGPVLGAAARALHASIKAPLSMCCQSVLAGACLACQHLADVKVDGRRMPISCFFLSIAESGERKSALDTVALLAHRQIQADLEVAYRRELLDFENADLAFKKSREAVLKKAKSYAERKAALDELGPPPETPRLPRLVASEPTLEGLYKLLQNGRPSIGLFSDEAGSFIGGNGMNDENRLKMSAGLSSLWDGKGLDRTRAGDGASSLPGRRVCGHLMAQPAVAAKLFSDALIIDQGLTSRFLPVFPQTTRGTRAYSTLDLTKSPEMIEYHTVITAVLNTLGQTLEDTPEALDPLPISPTPEARALWIAFHDLIEGQSGPGAELDRIKGFANKTPEHALRLAGLLSIFDGYDCIDFDHMGAGIKLAEFYVTEVLRMNDIGACDPNIEAAEKLRKWASSFEYIHLVQVYQHGPYGLRDAATAKVAAGILEAHGWLTPVIDGMVLDGAHRKTVWRVVRCS